MKSQTWKVSSMSRCTSEENNNCSLRGFTLTEFGEKKNQSKYDRVNNVPTLDADVKLEENNSLEQGAAIVCHNVTKWYNNREPVLSDLNMRVPCGSVVDSRGNNRNACAQLEAQLPCCPTPNPETRGYRLATVKNTTAGQLQQTLTRIKTLVYKNFIVMIRNILLLSFVVWIPAAEMYTSNIAFEFNPKSLKMGIINLETNLTVCTNIIPNNQNCSLQNLSCEYLAAVDPDIIEFVNFDSAEDAEAAVHSGWLRGYLVFPQELSQNLYTFAIHGASTSDSVYNSTIVIARFDETNKAASISIKWELFNALDKFLSNVLMSCGLDPRTGISPLQYGQPIYGKPYANLDMREFTLPGVAIIVTFFFPIIVMGTRFIEERNCGMLVRSFVQGAQPWEICVAYLLSEFWVLMAQAILVFIVAVPIGGLEFAGSIWLALALLLLNGYCGSAFGILLGSVCHEKLEVGILTIGVFFPNIFLSGIGWPVEGMPEKLQTIVNILPCTLPAESLRSIVARGLEFSDHRVWPGFVALFVHMLFYSGLIMLIQRRKYTK
ncbi:unnamed protein product [Orchesella dallaii]|uniref:ABC transmembrane type-2 domain-containing protein n=1 Tax=Orchesella dallaii TaxID=48710 RepID=A0ABP1Q404_9HEXA